MADAAGAGAGGRASGQGGVFYGWVIVAAAFVVMMIGFGVAYSFGAFFKALQAEFSANRGEISLIFSLSGFLYFAIGIVSGPAADRFGPRWVCAGGIAMIAAGLIVASFATSLWQIYVIYGLSVGLGVGFSYVPAVGAVQRWFTRRRGLASGLAVAGIGVGTFVMPFVASWLIGSWDWRTAYVAMGVGAAILGIVAALLIEASPEKRGLLPDGERASPPADGAAAATPVAAALQGVRLKHAMRSRPFIFYFCATFLTSLALFIPFVHLPAYATDRGMTESTGVLLLGIFGIGSIVGRFALGGAADRYGRRNTLLGLFLAMAVMLLWWWGSESFWMLAAFAIVFGSCYGGFVALSPSLMMDFYGGRSVSGIIGVLYSGAGVGVLIGPTVAGLAYDLVQSYTLPILGGAVANLIAAGCVAAMPQPEKWRAAYAM